MHSPVFLWFLWLDWATRQAQVPLPVSPRSVLYFLSEGRTYCVVQTTLGLLSLSDPPSSAALVARTVSICYLTLLHQLHQPCALGWASF